MERAKLRRDVLWGLAIGLIATIVAVAGAPAWAAETRSANHVTVPESKIVDDDLYAAGGTISIDGTVTGDVIAVAQTVVINGDVGDDVNVGAQAVVINGRIRGTARVGCQSLSLGKDAIVEEDVLWGGYSLVVQPGARIRRDVLAGGYQALLAGNIERNLKAGVAALQLDGTVGRDMIIETGDEDEEGGPPPSVFMSQQAAPVVIVPVGLTLGDGARVGGKLVYTSKKPAKIAPGAKVSGGIEHKTPKPKERVKQPQQTAVSWALDQIRRLIALVLFGLLLVWLVPGWLAAVGEKIEAKPAPSFGWGLLVYFIFGGATLAVLVAMIVLAILFGVATLGGVSGVIVGVGLLAEVVLGAGFWLYVAVGGPTIVGLLGGRMLLRRGRPETASQRVVPFLIGAIVLWALTAIPWIGALVSLVATTMALGGLWMWGLEALRRSSSESGDSTEPAPS